MWRFVYVVVCVCGWNPVVSAPNLWLFCLLLSFLCNRWVWALALCWCTFQLLWLPLTSPAPWLCSVLPFGSWTNSEESQNNSKRLSFVGLKLCFWELIREHRTWVLLREWPWHVKWFPKCQGFTNSLPIFEIVTRSRISLTVVTLTVPFQICYFSCWKSGLIKRRKHFQVCYLLLLTRLCLSFLMLGSSWFYTHRRCLLDLRSPEFCLSRNLLRP